MPVTDFTEWFKLFIAATLSGFGANALLGFLGVVIGNTLNICNIK